MNKQNSHIFLDERLDLSTSGLVLTKRHTALFKFVTEARWPEQNNPSAMKINKKGQGISCSICMHRIAPVSVRPTLPRCRVPSEAPHHWCVQNGKSPSGNWLTSGTLPGQSYRHRQRSL